MLRNGSAEAVHREEVPVFLSPRTVSGAVHRAERERRHLGESPMWRGPDVGQGSDQSLAVMRHSFVCTMAGEQRKESFRRRRLSRGEDVNEDDRDKYVGADADRIDVCQLISSNCVRVEVEFDSK